MYNFKPEPLHTQKGSKIYYSKYGVGKEIGGKVYVEKHYAHLVVPKEDLVEALNIMEEFVPEFQFKIIIWDNKHRIIRFVSCPSFNYAREPIVGKIATIDLNTFSKTMEIKYSHCPQIYHSKWLFVKPEYIGFNTQESYEWSKLWLSKLNEPASGYIDKWNKQLKFVGLE